jgi:4-nitrophenyl phosphatase
VAEASRPARRPPGARHAVRALVLDLDGVLWRGDQVLPGVAPLFEFLAQDSIPFCLASNNATLTIDRVIRRLEGIAIPLGPDRLVTSADAAAGYLRRTFEAPPPVLVIGEGVLRRAIHEAGCTLVDRSEDAEVVVVGMDRELTWAKLVEAGLAISAGARFIGTNPDRTFPTERGIGPGNGAILAALESATGRSAIIVGKPEAELFLEATRRLGVPPEETLVVGDRLETDIIGGQRARMQTALVLTGVTSAAELPHRSEKPDLVFDGLPELLAWLSRRSA